MNRGASTHEKNARVVWTDEMQKALERHVKVDGLSASKTAKKLARKFRVEITRHAIIGRANRTGVMFKATKFDPKKRRPRKMQEAVALKPRKPARGGFPKLVYSSAGREIEQPKQRGEPKARGDVEDGCRFMHGESSLRNFCGAPCDPRHPSWCTHHLGRIFIRHAFVNC